MEASGKQKFSPTEKAILTKKISKFLNEFQTKFETYKYLEEKEMKLPAANFYRWQHAYSILKLLQLNVEALPKELQPQFKQTLDTINPFLAHVEKLGNAANIKESLLGRLITKSKFPKYQKKEDITVKDQNKKNDKGDNMKDN